MEDKDREIAELKSSVTEKNQLIATLTAQKKILEFQREKFRKDMERSRDDLIKISHTGEETIEARLACARLHVAWWRGNGGAGD